MEQYSAHTAYAEAVINGEIVAGLYVKQAAQRYLTWLKRDDLLFMPDKADRVIKFIERFRHYEGKSAGQRFTLLPWQRFFIYSVYGFYYASDPSKRVVRNVYLECARKQGKSMLIAALSLYHLLADGEGAPQCYCLANSSKQAQLLFNMSATLMAQLDPRERIVKQYRDMLKCKALHGIFRALPNNAKGLDGLNASFVVTDEYAAASNSMLYDVLKSSQLQRRNPLNVVITTAGYNLLSPCYAMRNTCASILAGLAEDDTQFALIYEADEADAWDDPNTWAKSNPNLNVTIYPEDIAAEINRAKNNATVEPEVRTKTLNMWLQSASVWLSPDTVNKASKDVDLNDYRESTVYLGVDLASVGDLTAVALLIPTNNTYIYKVWYFLPQSALNEGANASTYRRWQRQKKLIVTPGNVTDYSYILTHILKLQNEYDLFVAAVFYDNWNSTQWAIDATEAGLYLQPFSQSIGSYNRPTKEFERQIKRGEAVIDNSEVTRWCISNVALKTDHNDNCKPVKSGAQSNKIDGVIAILTALGGYLNIPHYNNEINI